MAELLTVPEVRKSRSAPGRERRRNRRAAVCQEVRVRPVDSKDGDFEEVRSTLNASRAAIYFLTSLDRYCRGMRLRITSPYGPFAGSGSWEDTGEVVRVDHRADGRYGVAVMLSARSHLATSGGRSESSRKGKPEDREQRGALRYPFVAAAEVIDPRTGTRMSARTSDLSLQGCYLDMLNPFPVGATLRLRIHKGQQVFAAPVSVSSQFMGSGMGLVFQDITPEQRSLLVSWLRESANPSELAPEAPLGPQKTQQPAGTDHLLALQLIRTLLRKGLLSQAEVAELLGEPQPLL